jgi:hypothetical protein
MSEEQSLQIAVAMVEVIVLMIVWAGFIAHGAARLGYSGRLWFLVALGAPGLIPLAILSDLPDRNLEARRQYEREILEAQLAAVRGVVLPTGEVVPVGTISGDETVQARA